MMSPKDSIVATPGLRSAIIGSVMIALLASLMGLAWGMTGAPLLPPRPPEPPRAEFKGVSLALPSAWALESSHQSVGEGLTQWYFQNTVSRAERLRVFRFNVEPEADPRQVLGFLVKSQLLVAGLAVNQGAQLPIQVSEVSVEWGEALDTIFTIQRNSSIQTSPQLHAARLFTPDRKQYWLFQLTDQIARENRTRQAELGHQEQLRRIVDTLRMDPPDS